MTAAAGAAAIDRRNSAAGGQRHAAIRGGSIDADLLFRRAGLVLELDEHRMQRASKLLAPKCNSGQLNVFLLVEKKQKDPDDSDYDPVMPYYYAPLIDHCAALYPDIKVLLRRVAKAALHRERKSAENYSMTQ